ncbi:3'-5' exoribonuclease [Cupriavidus sp. 2SB]|uniref:3'-5' exoribonuclease n=1 Tax=Cupriavidus sp. 2SB TaxID=2502199 RepID=UPI0010F7BE37|nr:3'-5' exoribonuclease [Cupriavidus sp. 2SB]
MQQVSAEEQWYRTGAEDAASNSMCEAGVFGWKSGTHRALPACLGTPYVLDGIRKQMEDAGMGLGEPTGGAGNGGPLSGIPRSRWKTRYFIDTEFTDFVDSQLISVAIVGEDGCEFYGERSDFDRGRCSPFVREIVLPQLGQFPGRSMPCEALRAALALWLSEIPLRPKPVLCYDADCDYELVTELLGGPLPRGWRHENVFLKLDPVRLAQYLAKHGGEHHALHDARGNAYAFR